MAYFKILKKIIYITAVLSLISLMSLAQMDSITSTIKSIENRAYLAVLENDQIIKGKPYPNTLSYYPIEIEQLKKEYDNTGVLKKVYYLDNNSEYKVIEHINHNERNDISRMVYLITKFNDSLVMDLTYDLKGNLEKIRINKSEVSGDTWFSEIFGKSYYLKYKDSDCHNYYLTDNDSLNRIKTVEFENIELINDHTYNLYDSLNNLVLKREMFVKNANEGTLLPKKMDSIFVRTDFKYNDANLITEKFESYDRLENKGYLKTRRYVYEYTNDNKIKTAVKTEAYDQLNAGFSKIKARTVIFKEEHEYLNENKKHVIRFYDNYFHNEEEKLKETVTEIYNSKGDLIERVNEFRNRKIESKFDERSNSISYSITNIKRNKKISHYILQYVFNEQGDWIKRIHFDHLKNKPLYIEERTIEYY